MPTATRKRPVRLKNQPDLASALSAELGRLVEAEVDEKFASLRGEIADLRRRLISAERGGARRPGPSRKGITGETAASAKLSPDAIRAMRKRLGISQAELAMLCGVTPVAVYFWESARTKPTGGNVDALIELRGQKRKSVQQRVRQVR